LAVASWTFHHRTDLRRDLRLEIVTLVQHERHVGAAIESMGGDDLVDNPEKLKGVGSTDHQVVVGVEAAV